MSGRMPMPGRGVFACAMVLFAAGPLAADPADLCLAAGQRAAAAHGVPPRVMAAITLTETGRGNPSRPWPWAINAAGDGHWFDTRQEALAFARRTLAAGKRNFDVGCFQLNYRWHARGFPSLEVMFDPDANAAYAARFLSEIYPESRNWSVAAGTYHSRTQVHATRYRAIFDRHLARAAEVVVTSAKQLAPRMNSFPLLQRPTSAGRLGSLVSLGGSE